MSKATHLIRKDETMKFVKMKTGNKKPWTLEERQYMLAHHKDMFVEDIAGVLGRTAKAVSNKAFRMGCSFKSQPKGI